ncbi:MAG: hypothetical protein K1X78_00100 [Verrucomicrobiaceae bacterium]|nr:hypothetical protein [Verrucomicrobiaceae bacterium]
MKPHVIALSILLALASAHAQSDAGRPPQPAAQPKISPKVLRDALSRGVDLTRIDALTQDACRLFGRNNLLQGKAGVRVDGTTAAWAIIDKTQARVVKEDGALIGTMLPVGTDGLQVLALDLPNFSDFNYRIEAGGMTRMAGSIRIEQFDYPPDSLPHADVPKGRLEKFEWRESKIFPNTVRNVTVYIPAAYKSGDEACLMVWQDGTRHADPAGQMRAPVVFDNLIHQHAMPVTIGVFVDPGRGLKQKPDDKAANRGFEYDSLGDAYVRFLLGEILPQVQQRFGVRFKTDPASRAIGGGSSGGICAFTAAWERPDQFGKVLSWVGSFVNLRGGHVYPYLVRITERKPLRVYLLDGTNDLDNPYGNWPLANRQMAAALDYMKYDFRIDWTECFHGSKGMSAHLPEALKWLWRH